MIKVEESSSLEHYCKETFQHIKVCFIVFLIEAIAALFAGIYFIYKITVIEPFSVTLLFYIILIFGIFGFALYQSYIRTPKAMEKRFIKKNHTYSKGSIFVAIFEEEYSHIEQTLGDEKMSFDMKNYNFQKAVITDKSVFMKAGKARMTFETAKLNEDDMKEFKRIFGNIVQDKRKN